MGTFKKGDWVRVVDERGDHRYYKNGEICQVESVGNLVMCVGKCFGMYSHRFEPWTPAVGDRVRVTGNAAWAGVGEVYDLGISVAYVKMLDGHWAGREGGFPFKEIEPAPAKFKVGDRVRYVGAGSVFYTNGKDYDITGGNSGGWFYLTDDNGGGSHSWGIEALSKNFAPIPTTTPLQIEAGRYYKTRDWRKVGPMVRAANRFWPFKSDGMYYQKDGFSCPGEASRHADKDDLIAIWPTTDAANNNTNQPEIGTAIVCVFKDGQPAPAATPRVHEDVDSARAEAKRLGGIRKGETFGVYKLVATHAQAAPAKPEYAHEWQRLAAGGKTIGAVKELRGATGLNLQAAKAAVEGWLHYQATAA